VHPVLQDVLIVAALAALAYARGVIDPLLVPAVALGAFALLSLPTLLDAKRYPEIIAMFWVGPLAFLARGQPRWELPIAAALFAIGLLGTNRVLARLPWRPDEPSTSAKVPTGWPFARLGDPGPNRAVPGAGLFAGLLVGWWVFALARVVELDGPVDASYMARIACAAGAVLAMIRFGVYANGYRPPIGLLGRVLAGRWVIPGYDVILVAPVCTLLVAVAVAQGLRAADLPGSVVLAASLAASITAATELGPDLRAWRLTGHHRIHPALQRVKFERL
jgi:hypothetical protein